MDSIPTSVVCKHLTDPDLKYRLRAMAMDELDFPQLPVFPADVPTAPLLRLSLDKLVNKDPAEVERLWKACTELGFFYLDCRPSPDQSGFGGKQFLEDAYGLFDVADEFFALPVEEKQKYDFKSKGSYFGYKGYGSGIIDAQGTKDRNEFYNTSKDDILGLSESLPAPDCMYKHRSLFASFMRKSHSIVLELLDLLNDKLQLPKGTLPSLHKLEERSGDQTRFVRSPPQPEQDRRTALGAHTDFGSVTLLFNRLGGLQILPPGKAKEDADAWLYVRPLRGHCIVNLGDALVKFTRGILRSNIHRVVNPPGEEQGSMTRMSLVYFNRPADPVLLRALDDSELIKAAKEKSTEEDEVISARDWTLRRALGNRGVGDWKKARGTEAVRQVAAV